MQIKTALHTKMCASVGEKIVGLIRGKIDLLKKVGNRTQEENRRNQAEAEEGTEKDTAGRNEGNKV